MISKRHPNRKTHNYKIYDTFDEILLKNCAYIKGNVYDLGCGKSPYKTWISTKASGYFGVDWSSSVHDCKPDLFADLNKLLPLDSEVADTIISFSVMEHLSEPQIFLNESFRILKPDGYLLLQVPFMWWVHEAPHDYYRYTSYGLTYMLEKSGYSEIVVTEQTGFWLMWFLKLNYQIVKCQRGPKLTRWLSKVITFIPLTLNQIIGSLLDRFLPVHGESAAYFVRAKKVDSPK